MQETLRSKTNTSEKHLSFAELFVIPKITLTLCGLRSYLYLFNDNLDIDSDDRAVTQCQEVQITFWPVGAAVFMGLLIILNMVNKFHADIDAAVDILSFIVIPVLTLTQVSQLHYWKREIQQLLEDLKYLWHRQLNKGVDDKVIRNARKIVFISYFYYGLLLSAPVLYILRAGIPAVKYVFVNRSESYVHKAVLPITYPFAINTIIEILGSTFLESYVAIALSVTWATCDSIFFLSNIVIVSQLSIFGNKLQSLRTSRENYELMKQMGNLVKWHSKLLCCCRRLEKFFKLVILTVTVYPRIALYVHVISGEQDILNLNLLPQLLLLLRVLLYCISAESISYWTENISRKVYECQWTESGHNFKTSVRIVMIRAQENYKFRACGFYSINMNRLLKITLMIGIFIVLQKNIKSVKS